MTMRWPSRVRPSGVGLLTVIAVVLTAAVGGCGAGSAGTSAGASRALGGSAAPTFPDLAQTFTSPVNHYSIGYPAGGRVSAATIAAPIGVHTWDSDQPYVDNFIDTSGTGSITVVSAAIPAGTTPERWVADELTAHLSTGSAFPECAAAMTTEPILVDGVAGVIDTHCSPIDLGAVVTEKGRAYLIDLRGDPPDRGWFLKVLATVHLNP
jgi:hypothetical protein